MVCVKKYVRLKHSLRDNLNCILLFISTGRKIRKTNIFLVKYGTKLNDIKEIINRNFIQTILSRKNYFDKSKIENSWLILFYNSQLWYKSIKK